MSYEQETPNNCHTVTCIMLLTTLWGTASGAIEGALGAKILSLNHDHYNVTDATIMTTLGGTIISFAIAVVISIYHLLGLSTISMPSRDVFQQGIYVAGVSALHGLIGHALLSKAIDTPMSLGQSTAAAAVGGAIIIGACVIMGCCFGVYLTNHLDKPLSKTTPSTRAYNFMP